MPNKKHVASALLLLDWHAGEYYLSFPNELEDEWIALSAAMLAFAKAAGLDADIIDELTYDEPEDDSVEFS